MAITRVKELTADTRSASDYYLIDPASSTAPSLTKAKTGTYSYKLSGSPLGGTGIQVPFVNEFRCGFWLNHLWMNRSSLDFLGTTNTEQYLFNANDTYVTLNFRGILSLYVDNVLKATALAKHLRQVDVWHHIGFTYKADADGFASLYVDGEKMLTYTGLVSGAVSLIFPTGSIVPPNFWTWGLNVYIDDIYVDISTDEIDTCPPPLRFLYSVANGAGVDAGFSSTDASNYQAVDDAAAPDDDTTYNSTDTDAVKDTFTTTDITVPNGHVINAAIPWVFAKNNDSGDLTLHSYISPDYESGPALGLVNGYTSYSSRLPLQPDGVSAWDEAAFNAAQFGYESVI